MDWREVGDWLKNNAGTGAALVGGLLSGNIPMAVAAGVSLVTSATGETNPDKVLEQLQTNPATVLRLRELALENEKDIRDHVRAMAEIEAKERMAEHEQTQLTTRSGDNAEDKFVRRTRPAQSWVSLAAALFYGLTNPAPEIEILLVFMALPMAYAGLRQIGKWANAKFGAPNGN